MRAAFELIHYRRDAAIANIELNRPDALNACSPAMADEIRAALADARDDPRVRAVLLTGAGRAFCAGADVTTLRPSTPEEPPDLATDLREHYNPLVLDLRSLPKPVVAAVQGPCAGIAVSFALACDLLLAADNAYFLLAFVKLGLSLDGGASAFLAERIGLARAAQWAFLGERLPAARAREWGLVNAVHPLDELGAAARELTARLAAGPTMALGRSKLLLGTAAHRQLAEQLELETTIQQLNAGTLDYAEGAAAFREKRAATFVGG